MGYSKDLEHMIDLNLINNKEVIKKKMFGGLGYLINGNMCFGVHQDKFVLRTTEEHANALMGNFEALPFDVTGRPMKGWVMIEEAVYKNPEKMDKFINSGLEFARSLPPKSNAQ